MILNKYMDFMKMNEYGLYDIYDMWHQPWWQRKEYLLVLVIAIASGIIALIIALVMRYRRQHKILTPWEQALHDIKKVKAMVDAIGVEAGKVDRAGVDGVAVYRLELEENGARASMLFYVEMSKILKRYMYDRYAYAVKNSTDLETIVYLRTINFNKDIVAMVTEILSGGQYVKFAGQTTVKKNIERHFDIGIEIIQKTIPSTST